MISQRDLKQDFGTDATKTKRYIIYIKEQTKVLFRKHELSTKSKKISGRHFFMSLRIRKKRKYFKRNNEINRQNSLNHFYLIKCFI